MENGKSQQSHKEPRDLRGSTCTSPKVSDKPVGSPRGNHVISIHYQKVLFHGCYNQLLYQEVMLMFIKNTSSAPSLYFRLWPWCAFTIVLADIHPLLKREIRHFQPRCDWMSDNTQASLELYKQILQRFVNHVAFIRWPCREMDRAGNSSSRPLCDLIVIAWVQPRLSPLLSATPTNHTCISSLFAEVVPKRRANVGTGKKRGLLLSLRIWPRCTPDFQTLSLSLCYCSVQYWLIPTLLFLLPALT